MVQMLIELILLGVAFWAVNFLAGPLGLPGVIVSILYVVFAIWFVLILLRGFGYSPWRSPGP